MRRIALILLVLATGAKADEWKLLDDSDIKTALSGQALDYETAWQEFTDSGRTLYNAGRDSWGYWEVRGDKYCSQWPPADGWACYGVARNDNLIRFTGDSGDHTIGKLRP